MGVGVGRAIVLALQHQGLLASAAVAGGPAILQMLLSARAAVSCVSDQSMMCQGRWQRDLHDHRHLDTGCSTASEVLESDCTHSLEFRQAAQLNM